ncbi:MAG: TolC family protein [Candidatus Omnitrophica bacterium]|nr:TolC family protein [Candidatus Omnitrophota bacterium]
MKRINLLIIIFVLLISFLVKAEEVTLTLEEAVAIALRDNRDVLLQAQEVEKVKEKLKEAYAPLYPSVNFSGGLSYWRGYYPDTERQIHTQTSMRQTIFQGGAIINTIKLSGYNIEIAKARLDSAKLNTALAVRKAFYTALLAGEFCKLNKSILDNTKEHLIFIKERYQKGQASESDIISLEASLKSVEEIYTSSINDLESSCALLANLLYLKDDVVVKPQGEFSYNGLEMAYDEAFLKAMSQRPEIREYEAQEKAARKSVAIAKAGNRPIIYASWDYYTASHQASIMGLKKNWSDYNILGITLSWPIFDGFATKHKVEEAIIGQKQTQLIKEKAIKDIVLELKEAYLALKSAIAKINSAEADIRMYQDQKASIEKKYREGVASHLDYQDAELSYEISIFNKKQAIYDYLIAKSNFEKATGGW